MHKTNESIDTPRSCRRTSTPGGPHTKPLAADDREKLRCEVEAALIAEVEHLGPKAFNRAAVLCRFQDRGVCRASLFRWAQELFA